MGPFVTHKKLASHLVLTIADRNQHVFQLFELNSRSLLLGEQPNLNCWIQQWDKLNQHRNGKLCI
jgi:hypothetical protein